MRWNILQWCPICGKAVKRSTMVYVRLFGVHCLVCSDCHEFEEVRKP